MKKLMFMFVSTVAFSAMAADISPLQLTIYNENMALVQDKRTVNLNKGQNVISFAGVSDRLIPESALIKTEKLQVLEQNFNFDLMTPANLLEKSIGETVKAVWENSATGEQVQEDALLLAVHNGKPVLKMKSGIEVDFPGRVILNKIPQNITATPTFSVLAAAENTAQEEVALNYLTTGLSWQADYVGLLSKDENTLNCDAFITLTNSLKTDFKNAAVRVLVGEVAQTHVTPRVAAMEENVMMFTKSARMADTAPAVQAVADYQMYTLPETTDVLSNQTKQVSLFSLTDIPVQKQYEIENPVEISSYFSVKEGIKPTVSLSFKNDKNGMPAGVMRLYRTDEQGDMVFLGEDRIANVALGEKVQVQVGKAFEITAKSNCSQYEKTGNVVTASYEVDLQNSAAEEKTVVVKQRLNRNITIDKESQKHTQNTANIAEWSVVVPAGGEAKLSFSVKMVSER